MNINTIIKFVKNHKKELKMTAVATLGIVASLVCVKTSCAAVDKIKEAKVVMDDEHIAEETVLAMEEHPEYDEEAYNKDVFGTNLRFGIAVAKSIALPIIALVVSVMCMIKFPGIAKSENIIESNITEEAVVNEILG